MDLAHEHRAQYRHSEDVGHHYRHLPGCPPRFELFRKLIADLHGLNEFQALSDEIEHRFIGRSLKFELAFDSLKLQIPGMVYDDIGKRPGPLN